MDPNQDSVPAPMMQPGPTQQLSGPGQATPAELSLPPSGGTMPAMPGLQPAPPSAPPIAAPGFLPPTVPVQPTSDQGSNQAGANAANSQPQPTGHPAAPAVADDGDLIEKEWVMRAKAIVEKTKLDPHEQTKELHALKIDYMKKRYNKTIGEVAD